MSIFENNIYDVPKRLVESKDLPTPYVTSFEEYQKIWQKSVDNPSEFFAKVISVFLYDQNTILIMHYAQAAKEYLHWDKPFETTTSGDFTCGNIAWFLEGELNAAFNCVDRHAFATPDKVN